MADNAQFKLIIEDEEGRRSVVPVDLGEISIGRHEENAIRLNERNVSRTHAKLRKENGSVFAEHARDMTCRNSRRQPCRTVT